MSVPDPYAEERAFVATLPGWRRFLARLNWHSPLNDYLPGQGSSHPQKLSARNAVKATLLLLLGAGVFVFLVWSQYLLIVLLLIPVFLVGAALIFGLWRAIYDTLQEGESSRAK
jgi:Flp pilus assembly protein TadB